MRGDLDWNDDTDIETRVFFQPEDELEPAQRVPVPRPAPMQLPEASSSMRFARGTSPTPTMRAQNEMVDDRRYSIPSLANILEPQASVETFAVRRQSRFSPLQVGLASVCALLGITIGGLVAFTGHANVAVHAASLPTPAPAPVAVVAPVVVAAPVAPALVTLRVESSPAGASVMLVGEAGATTLVGTTPVATLVEGARDYDVLVKLADHAPRIEHVAAGSTHQVAINFDAAAPAVAAAPVHHHAKGKLRVGAKPPCSIAIDGRPTGMVTPQASIALPAGHHTVTLTNAEQGIRVTKDVVIQADQPTSLIQNFL
ncbi:MAG TPA: hypothetical protein VGG74_09635 [Kofleriaceae bacterium]|jgi:hypothetical protein